jgi:hypothetical protein
MNVVNNALPLKRICSYQFTTMLQPSSALHHRLQEQQQLRIVPTNVFVSAPSWQAIKKWNVKQSLQNVVVNVTHNTVRLSQPAKHHLPSQHLRVQFLMWSHHLYLN